ncbi:MAG: hypothetical protein K2H55_01805, partial [Helicobacter sp.]|nr:hypothetical protein [Helicobacter sp.]
LSQKQAFAVARASELPVLAKVMRQRRASASFDAALRRGAQGFMFGIPNDSNPCHCERSSERVPIKRP